MKAIVCKKGLSDDKSNHLLELDLPIPKATGYDLLVEIKAIAVNPIDYKTRLRTQLEDGEYKILGWDAAGIVKEVGRKVSLFKPGDEIWYAGDYVRPGCNSEYQLVDERLVGLKPKSLSFEQAAALPLTTITAWELLFDRLNISAKKKGILLVTGAAGGVGSILVQLAKKLTSLTVIGTAARKRSQQWVKDNGADYVVDHSQPLLPQLTALDKDQVDYVISLTHTDDYAEELVSCLKPQAKFALIDEPTKLDIKLFKPKSISIHWEMMFTRSLYKTKDMINQHKILTSTAKLVDAGIINTTVSQSFGTINAANINRAHELLLSGQSWGKIVLAGF